MRDTKFRGQDNDGKWQYGDLVHHVGEVSVMSKKDIEETPIDLIGNAIVHSTVKSETVGEFTCIKDKNAKEMYEHDIVNWCFHTFEPCGECDHYLKGVINYHQGGYILKIIKGDFEDAGFYGISELNFDEEDIEILGNVFDNPELLEDAE